MKVAFYNHTSSVSGAEISLLLTAKHLKRATPVVFAPAGELLDRAAELGLEVLPIASYGAKLSSNPLRIAKDVFGMLWAGLRFAQSVRRSGVNLVHANSLRAGIIAALFHWLHRRPIIWHVRDIPPGGIVGWGIQWLAARKVMAMINISEAVMRRFDRRDLGIKLHLVHNGVELPNDDELKKSRSRKEIRLQLETPTTAKVLVIIGQITRWKRQEDAVRAAGELIANGHDVYLWVVGEAKFREENVSYGHSLVRLADELGIGGRVRFTGFRQDIPDICRAADGLMLCSDNEPFGRVLIEAMSQSLPVVATKAGGVPEIVEDGVSGLLYPVGDVTALANQVSKLLTDESLRKRIIDSAERRVRRQFTIQSTAKKIEDIYDSIVPLTPSLRIAIVHDYLNQMGGAERVVAMLHHMFPSAPIYTTIVDREQLLDELADADIRTTWMQRIPGILKRFKLFFWLYPFAVGSMNLREYDLVISSSSAYAIGAPVKPGAMHICYCHTPMRFAWNCEDYMEGMRLPAFLKRLVKGMTPLLRMWDKAASRDVDLLIANSSIVRERVQASYGRHARLVFPPVDISRFSVKRLRQEDYYLVVSRLVSYKRIDLAVKACSELGVPLMIIGDGPDRDRLQSFAGETVRFLGRLPDEQVVMYMQHCKGLLFPGLEDFGITPLEANACGRPVVAYRGGGALDTIVPGLNGVFFDRQDSGSLADTLRTFDRNEWNPEAIREHAKQFDGSKFAESLLQCIRQVMHDKEGLRAAPDVESKRERVFEVKL